MSISIVKISVNKIIGLLEYWSDGIMEKVNDRKPGFPSDIFYTFSTNRRAVLQYSITPLSFYWQSHLPLTTPVCVLRTGRP